MYPAVLRPQCFFISHAVYYVSHLTTGSVFSFRRMYQIVLGPQSFFMLYILCCIFQVSPLIISAFPLESDACTRQCCGHSVFSYLMLYIICLSSDHRFCIFLQSLTRVPGIVSCCIFQVPPLIINAVFSYRV